MPWRGRFGVAVYICWSSACDSTKVVQDFVHQLALSSAVAFLEGGQYQLCYSDDGSFSLGHVDVTGVLIDVKGVESTCLGSDCLGSRSFNCYALLGDLSSASACGILIEGIHGALGRATWSARFGATYSGDGMPVSVEVKSCGNAFVKSAFFCPWGSLCMGTDHNDTVAVHAAGAVWLPPAASLTAASEASTIAICYCSGLRGCTDQRSFVQQVGVVHLFVASVTFEGDPSCTTSFSGVLAPLPFAVCLRCPPDACPWGAGGSRVRLAKNFEQIEAPVWSAGHQCHAAAPCVHLLPKGPASTNSDGGSRSDWRRFVPVRAPPVWPEFRHYGPDPGFSLPTWSENEEPGTDLDVCICLGACDASGAEWFKAGQLAVVSPRLTAAVVLGSVDSTPPHELGQQGQLALDRALLAYGGYSETVLGLGAGGGVRLAKFDATFDNTTAEACSREATVDTADINSTAAGILAYRGTVRGDRVVFDGGHVGRGLSINIAGVVVVCYCALLSAGDAAPCAETTWTQVGVLLISGPTTGQFWTLPTFRMVRFEYRGVDLAPTDTLRLVEEPVYGKATCASMPFQDNSLCPTNENVAGAHPICNRVGLLPFAEYSIALLEHDKVACDEVNSQCSTAPLKAVGTGGSLQFTFARATTSIGGLGDLGLADGDMIVLGSGFSCGTNCTREVLERAKGYKSFAGLEMYLDLDDATGTIAIDQVGSRNGAILGSAQWVSGYKGKALRFPDPCNSQHPCANLSASLVVGAGEPLDASRPWSLLTWVRMQNIGSGWQTICGLADADGTLEYGELEIGVSGFPWTNGAVFVQQNGSVGGEVPQMAVGGVLASGTWTHVAVVYSGSPKRCKSIWMEALHIHDLV
jgi:hypothetical protein